jgi:hypothetical protein
MSASVAELPAVRSPQQGGEVVTTSAVSTSELRVTRLAESWREEPWFLVEVDGDATKALPLAMERARRDLAPCSAAEVLALLTTLADRLQLPLPDGLALDLDVELMSAWPRDLMIQAFRGVWRSARSHHERFPTVADFERHIADELRERRQRWADLDLLAKKLRMKRSLGTANARDGDKTPNGGGGAIERVGQMQALGQVASVLAAQATKACRDVPGSRRGS